MSRVWSPRDLKAHFRNLVTACGGVQPAATALGISHQRVSQMQSLNDDDNLPTFLQVMTLEDACGRSVVFSAAAHTIQDKADDEIAEAAVAAVADTAEALRLVYDMDADSHREPHEIRDVQSKAQNALRSVHKLTVAAARLSPTKGA